MWIISKLTQNLGVNKNVKTFYYVVIIQTYLKLYDNNALLLFTLFKYTLFLK